jgi:hypothetical protein
MADRGPDGKFIKGSRGGPGRPTLEVNESVTALIDSVILVDDWKKIVVKLRDLALRGNLAAINALMDRRYGKPTERKELTGKDGTPLFEYDAVTRKLLPELASDGATETPKQTDKR